VYKLHYTPRNWWYKIEDKLHLGVHEQETVNNSGLDYGLKCGCEFILKIYSSKFYDNDKFVEVIS
jgi:hypothetical protein